MGRLEVIHALCRDDPSSPYPLEMLYWLEGLDYFELVRLRRLARRALAR